MYMTTLPLADARAQLSKFVEEATSTHERIEITKNGHRAAVLIGADVNAHHDFERPEVRTLISSGTALYF